MIGILVILGISWGLLYFFEKENLLALGFSPLSKRLTQFLIGFVFTCLLNLLCLFIETNMKAIEWTLNSLFKEQLIAETLWYHLKSTLTEDLVFRGALLYILIEKVGAKMAILFSAIAFGVYHWFSYGVLGSLIPMIYVFIVTGLTGYVWAVAFARSKSILLGLGLHLGWNFISQLFSRGPLGEILYVESSSQALSELNNLIYLSITGIAVPLITLAFIHFYIGKGEKQDRTAIGVDS